MLLLHFELIKLVLDDFEQLVLLLWLCDDVLNAELSGQVLSSVAIIDVDWLLTFAWDVNSDSGVWLTSWISLLLLLLRILWCTSLVVLFLSLKLSQPLNLGIHVFLGQCLVSDFFWCQSFLI